MTIPLDARAAAVKHGRQFPEAAVCEFEIEVIAPLRQQVSKDLLNFLDFGLVQLVVRMRHHDAGGQRAFLNFGLGLFEDVGIIEFDVRVAEDLDEFGIDIGQTRDGWALFGELACWPSSSSSASMRPWIFSNTGSVQK